MAIPTSRTNESPSITINHELCEGCGACVDVCSDQSLELKNKKASRSDQSIFDCIGCGQCMAVCPNGAIVVEGREIKLDDLYKLDKQNPIAKYSGLLGLLQRRRSVRKFRSKPVSKETIQKILDAVASAPMGLPPSDVHVMIMEGTEKTRAFAEDFSAYLDGLQYMTSKWFRWMMRPFWGKEMHELSKAFFKPLFEQYTDQMDVGVNQINYDAPLSMYFYGTKYCDPADPIIAATYAMIAGESLGLGTCMLGAIHPFIQKGKKAKKFREKHGIRGQSQEGLFVIFGYPKKRFKKGIKRSLASIDYHS